MVGDVLKTYPPHPGMVQILLYAAKIPVFVCQPNHHESVIYVTGTVMEN